MKYKCDKCNLFFDEEYLEHNKKPGYCPFCKDVKLVPIFDKYIAITIDGNTELPDTDGKDFYVENCQILLIDEAGSLEEFKQMLKEKIKDYSLENIWIYRVDTSFEPVRY